MRAPFEIRIAPSYIQVLEAYWIFTLEGLDAEYLLPVQRLRLFTGSDPVTTSLYERDDVDHPCRWHPCRY